MDEIKNKFEDLMKLLKDSKPDERSELARRFAVTITELEKAYSYFVLYVASDEE